MAQHVVFPELICGAIIEELHVYSTQGMLVKVGDKKVGASQHCGVGKELLRRAEWIAWYRGLDSIAVISGEGVREYYRARGYELAEGDGRFMIKNFEYVFTPEIVMVFTVFCAMIMSWMLNVILL
jgi:elongator complex protein 3